MFLIEGKKKVFEFYFDLKKHELMMHDARNFCFFLLFDFQKN